jgi:hypothetical protein
MKIRFGKGFSYHELNQAKVPASYSGSVGITLDKRRRHTNLLNANNVERLNDYMNKVLFLKKQQSKFFDKAKIHVIPSKRFYKRTSFRMHNFDQKFDSYREKSICYINKFKIN